MSLRGVKLVARQEFRVRLRSGRWRWLLASWFAVVGLFTLLLDLGLNATQTYYTSSDSGVVGVNGYPIQQQFSNPKGPPMFGWLMFFVLALTLVISPTLTAQSVNGDRERGTLATLQVTLLTPAEIAVGKLLAGWAVGLVALGLTVPFVGWSVSQGGVGVVRTVVTLFVVAILIGVICAISQALSALLARSITSALLSYVTVFALTVGTLIAFALSTLLAKTEVTYTSTYADPSGVKQSYTTTVNRTDYVWWLLAPNPFVVLADSAPALPPFVDPISHQVIGRQADVFGSVRDGVRSATLSPTDRDKQYTDNGQQRPISPVWPWGMGFDLLVGGLALRVTIKRLRSPADLLAKGVRIA